jgi:hypothetical protein
MGERSGARRTLSTSAPFLSFSFSPVSHPPHLYPSTEQADAYRLAGDDRQLYIMLMRFARFEKSRTIARFKVLFLPFSFLFSLPLISSCALS